LQVFRAYLFPMQLFGEWEYGGVLVPPGKFLNNRDNPLADDS